MCVKFPPKNLNPTFTPINPYTYGVIIAPKYAGLYTTVE